jgi:hypothetical protein
MAGRGALRGQQTRRSKYVRGSGRPWQTSVCFPAEQAEKLHEILDRLEPRPSMASVLAVLVARMPTGPDEPPLDWEMFEADLRALPGIRNKQEELPLVS